MHYVQAQGIKVPALGLGTWQMTGAQCLTAVGDALALGYRHLDTAQMYRNEAEVGQGLRESGVPRSEVWLTTKVQNNAPQGLIAGVDDSLRKLQTDYVDLLLIHWPDDDVPLAETLGEMLKLQKAGKARHLGISNFNTTQMAEAQQIAGDTLITNQVEYHPFLNQEKVHNACRAHNMFLTAYCPLARGLVVENAVIHKIAAEHGKTAAQVTLRWLVQQGDVVAIPKSAHRERLAENLAVFDFQLSDTEMNDISLLKGAKRLVLPDAGHWDGIE